jgi:hypothetical protein
MTQIPPIRLTRAGKGTTVCRTRKREGRMTVSSNPRAVNTPSKWQTRQPIYRTSVARWRRYEPWLGPLRALVDDGSQLNAGIAPS